MGWGLSTEQQAIIDRQVQAGVCRTTGVPNECLMADGSSAACTTIRECSPNLHYEYALPGVTPNVNINVWDGQGWTWNGTIADPGVRPGVGTDPFSGVPGPVIDYNQHYVNVNIPPQQVPGRPVNPNPTNVTVNSGGVAVAPAFTPAAQNGIPAFLQNNYGRTQVTQQEFCVAYQRVTGYPCDFNAAIGGSKPWDEWLSMLQIEQSARTSVVGNRTILPGTNGPDRGPVTGGGTNDGSGNLFGGNTGLLLIVGIVVIFAMKK